MKRTLLIALALLPLFGFAQNLTTITSFNGSKFRTSTSPHSKIIALLDKGTEVKLLEYTRDGYFKACVVQKPADTGYINEMWVDINEQIKSFVKQRIAVIEKENISTIYKQNAANEQTLIARYGKATYQKLKDGNYWLGMSSDMATVSLGNPTKINRTVGKWGTHEQWVYENNLYLYFENGKLTSFQD